ncbi:hypothetical protein [Sphaerimonospora thailandensis]|uniref:Uncharacterized protein n=1 Tax=Sphaerimonospora thailandensis TaxID=795644 RepID=A0A8J3R7I3_9ACTN|nr:hypothetical protein [Sphaerimonospora thailandensis]GIH69434.1 hypothetical protein Mth01_16870 [Sphaerimonospora thailandensis]
MGTFRISASARNAAADAVRVLPDAGTGGKLRIYAGTQPAGPDSGIGGATLLAEIALAKPAFGAAAAGVVTLAGTPLSATASGTGTAAWFRIVDSSGTAVMDGAVGLSGSGAELILSATSLSAGITVTISSGTVTMPASN